jgi:hypothetical protein
MVVGLVLDLVVFLVVVELKLVLAPIHLRQTEELIVLVLLLNLVTRKPVYVLHHLLKMSQLPVT